MKNTSKKGLVSILKMAMGNAPGGFVIIKSAPAQNLNYQTHQQPAVSFNFFFKKTRPLRVLIITKSVIVPNKFFVGSHI